MMGLKGLQELVSALGSRVGRGPMLQRDSILANRDKAESRVGERNSCFLRSKEIKSWSF